MRGIEEVIIKTLSEFSIKAERSAGRLGFGLTQKTIQEKYAQ